VIYNQIGEANARVTWWSKPGFVGVKPSRWIWKNAAKFTGFVTSYTAGQCLGLAITDKPGVSNQIVASFTVGTYCGVLYGTSRGVGVFAGLSFLNIFINAVRNPEYGALFPAVPRYHAKVQREKEERARQRQLESQEQKVEVHNH